MLMHALAPSLVTAPSADLIDVTAAKEHLRVDHSDDDDLIAGLIAAATAHLDGWGGTLGRCLINQTWRETFRCFPPCDRLRVRLAPVGSVTSITYRDAADVEQTLSTAAYAGPFTDALGAYVRLRNDAVWPSTYDRDDAVSITYVAGYGAAPSDVPQGIRHAVLLLVGHWYANREPVNIGNIASALPFAVDALLASHRRILI